MRVPSDVRTYVMSVPAQAAQGQPVDRRPGADLAHLVEEPLDLPAQVVGEFEFGEGTPASPARARRRADLHPGVAPERAARGGRRIHLDTCRRRRADMFVLDPSDGAHLTQAGARGRAEHDQLAGAQRAEDLVWVVEQAADPTAEWPERRGVAPADEADRTVDRLADRERGEDRRQREAAGVHHDQRPLAAREVLVATDADAPAQLGQRDHLTDETGVASPVVDDARRLDDETARELEHASHRVERADVHAAATRAGWRMMLGQP